MVFATRRNQNLTTAISMAPDRQPTTRRRIPPQSILETHAECQRYTLLPMLNRRSETKTACEFFHSVPRRGL